MGRTAGDSAESRTKLLTRRQSEILALLALGYSGPEIAEKLALAISSVRSHLVQIYAKLGVNGKRQALTRAAQLGLLQTLVLADGTPPGPHPPTPTGLPANDSFSALPLVQLPPAGVDTFFSAPAQVRPPNNLPLQLTEFFGRE